MSHQRLQPKLILNYFNEGGQGFVEDAVLSEPSRGIFALVDGFGGQVAGVEAAHSVRASVKDFLEAEAGDRDATMPFILRPYFSLAGNIIFNALIHANRLLHSNFDKKPLNERGGASAVAGYMDGRTFALASVGACSAHLIRGGEIESVAHPRSYERLVNPFHVSDGDGNSVPLAALGMHRDLEPEISEFEVCSGDWLLLSSGNAPDPELLGLSHVQVEHRARGDFEDDLESLEAQLKSKQGSANYSMSLIIF